MCGREDPLESVCESWRKGRRERGRGGEGEGSSGTRVKTRVSRVGLRQ